ncbi:MAG: DUF4178 domain-containing protein, partial [Planctomycetota bacterium]|nr:DUF4178 domain-containing protein [Planctomycetota bacterium]
NRPTLTMEDTKALANNGGGGGVDVLSAKVTDVRSGGLVSAEGFGDDYENCNLMIDGYNYIKVGSETWYEAVSEYKARKVAIEWQKRGGKNHFYVVKNHRCKTLSDIGLSEGDLESLADGKTVTFENVEFKFKKSGEGLFHKGEGGFGKKFDYWLFGADDDQYVRVEKLPGADITVSTARPTSEDQFEVMKVRG